MPEQKIEQKPEPKPVTEAAARPPMPAARPEAAPSPETAARDPGLAARPKVESAPAEKPAEKPATEPARGIRAVEIPREARPETTSTQTQVPASAPPPSSPSPAQAPAVVAEKPEPKPAAVEAKPEPSMPASGATRPADEILKRLQAIKRADDSLVKIETRRDEGTKDKPTGSDT